MEQPISLEKKALFKFLCYVSRLPWPIIYLLGDLIFILLYHIVRYRKAIVFNNLAIAFPEMSMNEKKSVAKKFYHQLSDTFLETLKLLTVSKEELSKRFVVDCNILEQLNNQGKPVHLHGGHFFNWEFLNLAFAIKLSHPFVGVYQPLSNNNFNQLMMYLRSRFGTLLVSSYNFNRDFIKKARGVYVFAIASDQNASNTTHGFWLPLFGKMVPFVAGPERLAIAKDAAVVFVSFYRTGRGFYQCDLQLHTTEPKTTKQGELTLAFRDFLESEIKHRPQNYLWSHRRWKHELDPNKKENIVLEYGK